jgi:ubiquinone/menaquinone biosynthesis C-methylase UbiE
MSSSLRKMYHNPKKILEGTISEGDNVLEIGPAMGFFSLPMARYVGQSGKVYCIDIQKPMLDQLNKKAAKAGLKFQIETRTSTPYSFNINNLENQINFCLLFAVVHEIPNQQQLFKEVYYSLKPGGKVLFAEPKGHVSHKDWYKSISHAEDAGLTIAKNLKINGSHAVNLAKP